MADSGQERTEEATPRKKQDARKKGTVTKSTELVNSLVLVSLMGALPFTAGQLGGAMMTGIRDGLSKIPDTVAPGAVFTYGLDIMRPMVIAFAPLVGVAMLVGVSANFAQVGFMLTTENLKPSLAKINPLAGLKRLFSAQAGMEGAKAIFKTGLFSWVAYQVIQSNWDRLIELSWVSTSGSLSIIGEIIRTIMMRVGMLWLGLAAVDYLFQRKQIDKQLRMTKDEVKQEFKQNEQSPELRGAMAAKRRKLLRGRMAQAVKTADVIITNPTHFAVAIQYDRTKMHAPQVVAKGQDVLAAKIREMAKDSRVPIVPNPPLARQLYKKCEVGDFVPRELFQAVAEVLAYVYGTLKKVGK